MKNMAKAKAKALTRRQIARCKAMEELGCYKKSSYKTLCIVVCITLFLISLWQLCNCKVARAELENNAVKVPSITEYSNEIQNDVAPSTVDSINCEIVAENFAEPETSLEEVSKNDDELKDKEIVVSSEEESNEEFIISLSQKELGMIVQAVQHEVGSFESFYPDADLDVIQQCMARVIINQVGRPGYGFHDTVYEVLAHPGHFMPLEELEPYDPEEPRTLSNVLTVLRGEDSISEDVIFEMSFSTLDVERASEIMEKQVGTVNIYFSTVTAEGRLLVFAEPATI